MNKKKNKDKSIPPHIVHGVLDAAERLGYDIRRESGDFESGKCIILGKKIILINDRLSLQDEIRLIGRIITKETESIFVPPAVRDFIESQ